MKRKIIPVVIGAALALCVPALVMAQITRYSQGQTLDLARLNGLVDGVNAQAASAPATVDSLAGSSGGGPVTRTYTAQGDGILTFVPQGGGFGGVTLSVSTNVEGSNGTLIARTQGGSTATIAVRKGQQYTLSFTNGAGAAPAVTSYWVSLRGNAPRPTF